VKLSQNAAKSCVEPSLLCGRELWGNDELGEIEQRLTNAFEAMLELGGQCGVRGILIIDGPLVLFREGPAAS